MGGIGSIWFRPHAYDPYGPYAIPGSSALCMSGETQNLTGSGLRYRSLSATCRHLDQVDSVANRSRYLIPS